MVVETSLTLLAALGPHEAMACRIWYPTISAEEILDLGRYRNAHLGRNAAFL